jgi:general secretion pathway protein J
MSTVDDTQKKSAGFTLVELLLAIFIFAIVISIVYGAYITILTTVDATEQQAEINNKARTALNRITVDLGSIYLGEGGVLHGQTQKISENQADTLEFTSSAHLVFSRNGQPAGFAMIRYSVEEDPESKLLQLYRTDVPFIPGYSAQPVSNQKGYLLCDGLRTVQFTYYDQAGEAMDTWQYEENSGQKGVQKTNIPTMIEVRLDFPYQGQDDLVFKTAVAITITDQAGSK